MATYTLTAIDFAETESGIMASATILKDGVPLQGFGIEVKKTTSAVALAKIVGDHAKRLVIHDTLKAETFTQAGQILAAASWEYSG